MSIRKKHIIRHYTIVEVMVAMGIFLVMMTIMMQFFTSAQKVWSAASKRNMLYADARVAMNLMTREIQCMLYSNEPNDVNGIYPFWYEWKAMNADTGLIAPKLSVADNYNVNYLTALNFISTTDIKAVDKGSDICEIRYKFIPIYFDGTPTVSNAKGGTLKRACTGEWIDDSHDDPDWDFVKFNTNPCNADRINEIWEDADFITVISGVYSLRFSCYNWNASGLYLLEPIDDLGNETGGASSASGLTMGTHAPVAVRIDMKLMDPKDLKKLAFAIEKSDNKQIKILKQKIRTFSKVIYLGKR